MNTTASLSKLPSALHSNLQTIARALRTELAPADDAGLSLFIDDMSVTIRPTRQGRLAAFFQIAEVDGVTREVLVSALSEAAAWGVYGETQRFVVLDNWFALLWSPAPLPEAELLSQLDDVIANALAVRELAARFPA